MLRYIGHTRTILILSVIIIGTVIAVQLSVQDIVPSPRISFDQHDQPKPLPPAFAVNASCENTKPTAKVTKLSQTLFPVSSPKTTDSWVGENHKMLRALFRCMELSDCGPNQQKVVILFAPYFLAAFRGWVSGEDIWARSTVHALREMGYTFLYTNNMQRTVQLYQIMPDLVKMIISEGDDAFKCLEDEENCILSTQNPDGIPAWKIFSFSFWPYSANPLGGNWTLSPEAYALEGYTPNTYLGYSVEPSCMSQSFVAHQDREDRAYILAKHMSFVLKEEGDWHVPAWPPHFYEAASNATGIKFTLGAHGGSKPDLPPGLTNHGVMSQSVFLDTLSRSRLLIGVGSPIASPTPYDALCFGVPFINPILDWHQHDPQDKTGWQSQHGLLKFLDPPFVYNVRKDDLDGFVKAIKDALSHPIDRHVLDRMRMSSVLARLQAILERDWKSEAAKLLAQRKAIGEGPLFTL